MVVEARNQMGSADFNRQGRSEKKRRSRRMVERQYLYFLLAAILIPSILPLAHTGAAAQTTPRSAEQISTVNNAPRTPPDGSSSEAAISPNSDIVVFQSRASNLVEGDTNNASDIFMRRIGSDAVTRLSVTSSGEQAVSDSVELPADSTYPAISRVLADGTYGVAFASRASNLAMAEAFSNTRNTGQIYLRVPSLKKTILISRGLNGTEAGNEESFSPSLTALESPNRFIVVFASYATNLVDPPQAAGDEGATPNQTFRSNLYVAEVDVSNPNSIKVKITDSSENVASGQFFAPSISEDGRFIVCKTVNSDFFPASDFLQIIRFDREKDLAEPITLGEQGAGNGNSVMPSISADGRKIAFTTEADNLGVPARQGEPMFVLWTERDDTLDLINQNAFGSKGDGLYDQEFPLGPHGKISPNGLYAVWSDKAGNLVVDDTNGVADIFLKDLERKTVRRINLTNGQQLNLSSTFPSLSFFLRGSSSDPDILSVFQTRATNVGTISVEPNPDPDQPGANVDRIFATTIAPPPRILQPNAPIATAPDVVVNSKKREVTINLVKFSLPKKKKKLVAYSVGPQAAVAPPKIGQIMYDVRIDRINGRKRKKVRESLETRNRVTIRKLEPGTYVVKYRVQAQISKKKTTRTQFSPERRFTIVK